VVFVDIRLPEKLLSDAIDLPLLDKLLDNARSLNQSISVIKPVIFSSLDPDQYCSADLLQKIKTSQCEDNEELRKKTARLQYDKMMGQVREAERGLSKNVEEANKSVDSSLNSTFADAGYQRSGDVYSKDIVVGSTPGGLITRHVSVNSYQYYNNAKLDLSQTVNLSDSQLDTLSSDALDERLDSALKLIQNRTSDIFGTYNSTDKDYTAASYLIGNLGLASSALNTTVDGTLEGDYVEYNDVKTLEDVNTGPDADAKKITEKFTQEIEWIEKVSKPTGKKVLKMVEVGERGGGTHMEEQLVDEYVDELHTHTEKRGVDLQPGQFGAHVGFAPEFSKDVDLDSGDWDKQGNIKFEGTGQMGTIMGQFIYNSMREGKGYAVADMPAYSKPLWDDVGSWVKAPSIRTVVDIGVTIAAMAVTGGAAAATLPALLTSAAINLGDDAFFTALDVSGGYETWQEGALSFGKQAACAAASVAVGGLFNGFGNTAFTGLSNMATSSATSAADKVVVNGLMKGAESFTSSAASSAINAVNLSYDADGNATGLGWDADSFGQGLQSGAISAAASMTGSWTTNGILGQMGGKTKGFYGSLANLAGDLTGEATKYSISLGMEAAERNNYQGPEYARDTGDVFGGALDAMGGLTFNVANLGSLLDLAQITGLSLTDGYDPNKNDAMNQFISNTSNMGLFEININSHGVAGQLGMGGMNLGGNLYSAGKGFVAQQMIANYEKTHSNQSVAKSMFENDYVYGDDVAEDNMWRILSGKDQMSFDGETASEAETIADEKGNRTIHMYSGYANATGNDALKAATVLQHEAWRNGQDDGVEGQKAETRKAVLAHSQIALALYDAYDSDFISGDANLASDVGKYLSALKTGNMSSFDDYTDNTYVSSSDFWRVIKDEKGNVTKVLDDGDKAHVTIVEADGTERKVQLQSGSVSGAIAAAVGNGMTREQMNSIMVKSGLVWEKGKGWYAKNETAKYTATTKATQPNIYKQFTSFTSSAATQIGDWFNDRKNDFSSILANLKQETNPNKSPELTKNEMYRDTTASLGNGSLSEPYLRVGSGFFDQTTQYADLGFDSAVGPCFTFSSMGPFLDAGYSQDQVITALKAVGNKNFDSNGSVTGNINEVWQGVANQLGADKYPAYLGASAEDAHPGYDIAGFKKTGATMGLYRYYNPNGSGQHWMYLSKQNGSWNAYEPWNTGSKGMFDVWGIQDWSDIQKYTIRPLTWVKAK
jgi:hypothetical protein